MMLLIVLAVIGILFILLIQSSKEQTVKEVKNEGGLEEIFFELVYELEEQGFHLYEEQPRSNEYRFEINDNEHLQFNLTKTISLEKPYLIQMLHLKQGKIVNKTLPTYISPNPNYQKWKLLIEEMKSNLTKNNTSVLNSSQRERFNNVLIKNPEFVRSLVQSKMAGDKDALKDYFSRNEAILKSCVDIIVDKQENTVDDRVIELLSKTIEVKYLDKNLKREAEILEEALALKPSLIYLIEIHSKLAICYLDQGNQKYLYHYNVANNYFLGLQSEQREDFDGFVDLVLAYTKYLISKNEVNYALEVLNTTFKKIKKFNVAVQLYQISSKMIDCLLLLKQEVPIEIIMTCKKSYDNLSETHKIIFPAPTIVPH